MLSNYRLSTINKAGSNANGMTLVLVDGGKYKDMIAARMRKPNGRGSWMVYKDCDLDYAEQVTAEHKVTERVNGKVVQKWVPKLPMQITTIWTARCTPRRRRTCRASDPLPAKPRAGEAKKAGACADTGGKLDPAK